MAHVIVVGLSYRIPVLGVGVATYQILYAHKAYIHPVLN